MPDAAMPRIAITTGFESARWGDHWEGDAVLLPAEYALGVRRAGGLGIVVAAEPALIDDPDLVLDAVDGLLISGGADVDPSTYGQAPAPELEETTPVRDRVELALIRRAIDRRIPLLGICRGLQLLNVATGGTLHQHLPAVVGHDEHRRRIGSFHRNRHVVEIRPDTLLADLHRASRVETASHHHQGIDHLGADLVVSAVAADGLPEAVELDGHRFALAVQWHPEVDDDITLIGALVDAARAHARRGADELLHSTSSTRGTR